MYKELRCDYHFHFVLIIKCEDQQSTASQEHDHVADFSDNVTKYCEYLSTHKSKHTQQPARPKGLEKRCRLNDDQFISSVALNFYSPIFLSAYKP